MYILQGTNYYQLLGIVQDISKINLIHDRPHGCEKGLKRMAVPNYAPEVYLFLPSMREILLIYDKYGQRGSLPPTHIALRTCLL